MPLAQSRQHDLHRQLLMGQALVGQQAEAEHPHRRRREQEAHADQGVTAAGDEPPLPDPASQRVSGTAGPQARKRL